MLYVPHAQLVLAVACHPGIVDAQAENRMLKVHAVDLVIGGDVILDTIRGNS